MTKGWIGIMMLGFASGWLMGCRAPENKLFRPLTPAQTGITFVNKLQPTNALNGFTFTNFYNGGGVGIGDVNNDGKPDIFLGGNQVSCRLYLNRVDTLRQQWTFEDITEAAGLKTDRWCTGVTMVDINNDGRLDLYVSVAKHPSFRMSENLLFVNQGIQNGIPHFREMAAAYGLADAAYTSQTAFLDYDLDGDLDAYLLNTAPDLQNPNQLRQTYNDGSYPSTGKLYRNDGPDSTGQPHFRDVSRAAGIRYEGLGLGLGISDLNRDGYPDLYCSNDFISSDMLYLNNGSKTPTFTNAIRQAMAHTSLYGMGVDIGDINNDGWPDVFQLDMLPEENARQKKMLAGQDYDRKELSINDHYGYQLQYMRNSLQLNLGTILGDGHTPRFSEVGLLAGVAKTDWSWSALLADYDNDGRKDIFITNGYRRDVTDRDFIQFTEEFSGFGTTEFQQDKREELIKKVPEVQVPNYAYRNAGELAFEDVSARWGLASLAYGNGAAYADLDSDGDLDLVINNIDSEASVYLNQTRQTATAHFVSVACNGPVGNRQGIGAKVTLWAGGQLQYAELTPTHGFQSSVPAEVYFGVGTYRQLDSIRIEWPGGKTQTRYQLPTDKRLFFSYENASFPKPQTPTKPAKPLLFRPMYQAADTVAGHRYSNFVDFKQTAALHKMLSRTELAFAAGDVNADGLTDAFVGGTYRGSAPYWLLQTPTGQFIKKSFPAANPHDDTGALLFDADGDTDLDLYVVSGGAQRPADDKAFYQDRLYVNNGKGQFTEPQHALPDVSASGSCVKAADFDHDGDLDLFVGGRQIPGRYPQPTRSYLLRNDSRPGAIRFTDVTAQRCPWLLQAGLVCDAIWSDADGDGWKDLVLVGEWMPMTLLKNQHGQRFAHTPQGGNLWGYSIAEGDFDHDGDPDYIIGNEGLNTLYRASATEPIRMVANDFNHDGTYDPIMGYYIKGVCYPAVPRESLNQQLIQFRRKYQRYADYANATFDDLFTPDELTDAYRAEATELRSLYVENRGKGQFSIRPLPRWAQQSPVFGIVPYDFDQDGHLDVVLTGNFYANEVNMGRQDASVGLLLLGDGKGGFRPVPPRESGLVVLGEARQSVFLPAEKRLLTLLPGQGVGVSAWLPKP